MQNLSRIIFFSEISKKTKETKVLNLYKRSNDTASLQPVAQIEIPKDFHSSDIQEYKKHTIKAIRHYIKNNKEETAKVFEIYDLTPAKIQCPFFSDNISIIYTNI